MDYKNIDDIKIEFLFKYLGENFVTLNNGVKTIEISGAQFIVDKDFIFGKPNLDYIQKELDWYKTQECNVNFINSPIPKIWQEVSDVSGNINSNYGWCIWSNENYNQYDNCLKELINDNSTRRACMIYNRPSMQYDYNKNDMSDFMCTFCVQTLIRNNKLEYQVYQRSCDAYFGYRNDVAWHHYVANNLMQDLIKSNINIESYYILYNCGSLHLYESQFYLIENYLNKNNELKINDN